ncbi:MAG TPA: hypothetical protein VKF80_05135 [Candidatus Eisenbacteria bacterium]|nr:hypothetical protein [Candidatus Eisenbacteria bacterium]
MIDRRSDRVSLFLLTLLYAATRLPFLYTAGFPDGDQTHTAVGILDAVQAGTGFLGTRIYALAVAPGFHALLFALRFAYASHPAGLIPLVSALGALAGLGAQIFLWLTARRLWGPAAAWLVSLVWLFAPGWWEVTTFGHPSILALCFVLGAIWWMSRGTVVAASTCFALAVLFRADVILAGAVFPTVAWLTTRRYHSAVVALIVPVAAFVVWAGVMRAIHPPAASVAESGTVARFFDVLQADPSVYRKELVILALGLGPMTILLSGIAWIVCLMRRRFDVLGIALALGVPALVWWIHVEGPFRHLLIVAVALVIPAVVLAEGRSVRDAVVAGVVVACANGLVMHALHDRLLASYLWTYRPAPGVARWSTRAPLDDWFSSHAAAARGVGEEARWAKALANASADSVLVVTPLPFRYEFAILERGEPHRYHGALDSTAIWIDLVSGGKAYRFLEGDPGPTQFVLNRAASEGRLRGYSIWIPPDAEPTGGYVIPAGLPAATLP